MPIRQKQVLNLRSWQQAIGEAESGGYFGSTGFSEFRACLEYYLPENQYFTNLTLKTIARLSR
ncbi:MAG: hypothetical protein AAGI49_12740 [Bacteroidota bacterium]